MTLRLYQVTSQSNCIKLVIKKILEAARGGESTFDIRTKLSVVAHFSLEVIKNRSTKRKTPPKVTYLLAISLKKRLKKRLFKYIKPKSNKEHWG